jgi:hypothetical protein
MKNWTWKRSVVTSLSVCALGACAEEAPNNTPIDTIDDAFLTADSKADFGVPGEGSPEALAVLRAANECEKDMLATAAGVGLGSTVANNLIAGRPYRSLAQLDAVPYVGKSAFQRLMTWSKSQGWVIAPNAGNAAKRATRTPWSGYWWSMERAETALGWTDLGYRRTWTEDDARGFDQCLATTSASCEQRLNTMASDKGRALSPLMKFDLWTRRELAARKGGLQNVSYSEFSHATRWELDNQFIGDDTDHPYWEARDYAGKGFGWALAAMTHDEPMNDVELQGIVFTPADVKAILASMYDGAKFFVPQTLVAGTQVLGGSATVAAYEDVSPADLLAALTATVDQGDMLEADLDPSEATWNFPVFGYDLTWQKSGAKLTGTLVLHHASDDVGIDQVFSGNPARPDLKKRSLDFEMDVAADWKGDLTRPTASRWVGTAVDNHPDSVVVGVEDDWRDALYEQASSLKSEVNFQLLKRAKSGSGWRALADDLLDGYYAKNK